MLSQKEMGRLMNSNPSPKFAASSAFSDSEMSASPSSFVSTLSHSTAKGDSKECQICGEKFGKVSNKRKQCAVCQRSVCENHSLKKRELPDSPKLQRVCDQCDEAMIKDEIRQEMEGQIREIEAEIKRTTEENERRERENRDKTMVLSNLEYDISKAEKTHKQKEQALLDRLAEEQRKNEKARNAIERLQKELDESHRNETAMADRCKEVDKQIEELTQEAQALRERKEDLSQHLQELEAKIKSSVALSYLKGVACPTCKQRLEATYKPRKSATGDSQMQQSASFAPARAPPQRPKPTIESDKSCKADCRLM